MINKHIIFIIATIYAVFLFPFYNIDYYIPDTFHYINWAQNNLVAFNTYSSVFMLFSKSIILSPLFAHVSVLLLLSVSMYSFLYFSTTILLKENFLRWMASFLVLSSGVWFYFYGKIFYDFPFGIASLSAAVFVLSSSINNNKKNGLFFLLLGFTLSWKLTYALMIIGLLSLLILDKKYCQQFFGFDGLRIDNINQLFYKSFWERLAKYGSFSVLGFIVGYFGIIYKPDVVLTQMFGVEKGGSSFTSFIFFTRIIWDHVNSVSVNLGNYFVPSIIIIFFIIPLFIKNKLYLLSSIVINILFYVFITYKSTGYLWHSFAMGVYLILFGIFMLKESGELPLIKKRIIQILMSVAIVMQLINNFGIYLPKQIAWHKITLKNIVFLQNNAMDIVENLQKVRKELEEESNYMLDFRRDTFKNKQRMNILNEYVPSFTEESKHPWNYNDKKYTAVIYLSLMNNPNMKEVYKPVFLDRKSIITRIYDGYTIKVFQNELK